MNRRASGLGVISSPTAPGGGGGGGSGMWCIHSRKRHNDGATSDSRKRAVQYNYLQISRAINATLIQYTNITYTHTN